MSHLSDSYRVSLQKPRRGSCEETVKGDSVKEESPDTPARLYMKMYTAADDGEHAFSVIGVAGRALGS